MVGILQEVIFFPIDESAFLVWLALIKQNNSPPSLCGTLTQ